MLGNHDCEQAFCLWRNSKIGRELVAHLLRDAARFAGERHDAGFHLALNQKFAAGMDRLFRHHEIGRAHV